MPPFCRLLRPWTLRSHRGLTVHPSARQMLFGLDGATFLGSLSPLWLFLLSLFLPLPGPRLPFLEVASPLNSAVGTLPTVPRPSPELSSGCGATQPERSGTSVSAPQSHLPHQPATHHLPPQSEPLVHPRTRRPSCLRPVAQTCSQGAPEPRTSALSPSSLTSTATNGPGHLRVPPGPRQRRGLPSPLWSPRIPPSQSILRTL